MFTTILLLAAVLFVGVTSVTMRAGRHHATRAWIPIAFLLPAFLFALEQLVRLGWSYDLVMRTPVRLYFPEAPVMAAYGILFLVLGAAATISLAIVAAMAVVTCRDGPSSRKMLALACLPAVALYAFQYHQGVQQMERVERDGYEQARRSNVRQAYVCEREMAAAAKEGCLRYVKGFSRKSDTDLTANGRRWAWEHHVSSENACQPVEVDFDPRPAFAAGCKAAVKEINGKPGERWAWEHKVDDPKDCEQDAQASEHPSDFLEGCAQGVHDRLSQEGYNWAVTQFIFDPADCHSRSPGTTQPAEFQAACESYVSHLSASERVSQGISFARSKQIQHAAECYTSIPNAPQEFKKGCEDEVRGARREIGKQWAQRKMLTDPDGFTKPDDCGAADPDWHDHPQEAQADFLEGCRNEVIQRRMAEGRLFASNNFIFAPEDCKSDLSGAKQNPDFIAGCEDFIQHRNNSQDGYNYAMKKSLSRLEGCHGAVKAAPPQFVTGCEKFVQDRERAEAQRR